MNYPHLSLFVKRVTHSQSQEGQIRGIAFSPQLQHSCYYQSLVLPLEVIG